MKKILLLLICFLVLINSEPSFAQQKIPIIVYHSVDDYKGFGLKGLYVSPLNFEKQINYLKDNGFTLLTFEQWQDRGKVNKPIFITFDDGYKNNINAFIIFQKLKDKEFIPSATIFAISDFIGRPNRLSASDLQKMSDSGLFSIQSHTATHPDLTKVKDYFYQLKMSNEKIEKITGKPVIALAYPYGIVNEKVVAETKKYYKFGLTTTPGTFTEKGQENENYLLPRYYIYYSTTLEEFANIVEIK